MKYVENGVPEDFAKLCFEGMTVPLCELTEEEYMDVVYGIKNYRGKGKRGMGFVAVPEPVNVMLQLSVDELELSVRAYNCLRRANIKTIGELCAYTEAALSKLRNMGDKTIKEIKAALAQRNLALKDEEELFAH